MLCVCLSESEITFDGTNDVTACLELKSNSHLEMICLPSPDSISGPITVGIIGERGFGDEVIGLNSNACHCLPIA